VGGAEVGVWGGRGAGSNPCDLRRPPLFPGRAGKVPEVPEGCGFRGKAGELVMLSFIDSSTRQVTRTLPQAQRRRRSAAAVLMLGHSQSSLYL
jgi:hypothetical protein